MTLAPETPPQKFITLAPLEADFKFKTPKLLIGGVPCIAQNFHWSFVSGANPFRVGIMVPDSMAGQFFAIQNPTEIRCRFEGEINGQAATFNGAIKNVWVTEPRKVDPFHWSFELADFRCRWLGQRFTWSANETWPKNAYIQGTPILDPSDPAILREQIDRYEATRYLTHTKNPATGKPWTALELLRKALSTLEYGADPEIDSSVADLGTVVEAQRWIEEPIQPVLNELATLARVEFGSTIDGTLAIYPAQEIDHPEKVLPLTRPPVGGGVVYKQDLRRIRPHKATIRFRKLREVLAVRTEAPSVPAVAAAAVGAIQGPTRGGTNPITSEDYATGKAVACWNVIQLPRDVEWNGVKYQKGQFVEATTALNGMGLPEIYVWRNYFDDLLIYYHAVLAAGRAPGDPPDPLRLSEALAVKRCYRRMWQMDPYWVQRWEQWDVRRVALIDPVSRYTRAAAVWTDYCLQPSIFAPKHARNFPLWKKRAWNYLVDKENPDRTHVFTLAELKVIDAKQGVFSTEYPQDPDQVIDKIYPTGIDNIPDLSVLGAAQTWANSRLSSSHTFEALVSVVPGVDDDGEPSDKRLWAVSTTTGDGQGPEIEWLSNEVVARIPHPQGTALVQLNVGLNNLAEAKESADARKAAQKGEPCNLDVLQTVAQNQTAIVMHQFRDRLAGYAIFPGVDPSRLRLFGACKSITIEFSVTHGLRTHYDLTSPPTVAPLISRLDPHARHIVYGQILADEQKK